MIQSKFVSIKISGIATAVPKNKENISEKFISSFGGAMLRSFLKQQV